MADKKNTVSFDEWANGAEVKPAKTGILGRAGDLGLSALKSAISVPETAVGLANIVSGGKAGKAVESAGIRFKDAKDILDAQKSDAAKDAEWRFQNAEGFTGKLGAAVENPSLIANTLVESAAPMLAGGVVGRGLSMAAPRLAGYAGAIGEGAIGAGSAAEQIRQESTDGELSSKQAALAGASGLATGLLGYGGSKLAGRMGVGDIDTALAGGARTAGVQAGKEAPGMLKRIGGGALSEGVFEELPQSVSEQMLQNVALDRDPMQGVDAAAAMGLLSGGLMGGGMGVVSRQPKQQAAPAQPPVAPGTTPVAPPASTPPAGPTLGGGLTGTPMADLMGGGGLTGGANPLQAGLSTLTSSNQMYPGMNTEPTGYTVDPETGAIIQAEPVGVRQMAEPAAQVEAPAPVAQAPVAPAPAPPALGESLTGTPVADMLGSGGMSGPANPLQSVLDARTPSQRMGLNPESGGLTAAAAIAVDSGASPVTAGMGLRALSGASPASQPVAEESTQQQAQPPAQQPILNNGKPFTLAEVGKANQAIGGTAVSVPGGWAIQPPQAAQKPAATPDTAMQPAATPAASAQSAILGRNSQPIAEGGQPFATREEAKAEKRLQPLMRVAPAEGGGFILKPASERQMAAVEKAAKRLKYPSTGETGPRSLHGFILQIGGLASGAMPDVGFDLNPRVGNRRLFSPRGKTIEQAAMAAKQEGYIQDEDENTLIEALKRSLNVSPVYTPDGYEAMAEAQMQARYEDFLAAEQDGGAENDWSRLTPEELAETGYNDYDEATQAEIRALVAQAEALGVDAESILEDVAQRTENATQKDYENAAKSAIEAAIRSSEESRSRDLGQAGAEAGPATADTQAAPAAVTGQASDVRARNLAALKARMMAGQTKPTPTTPPAQTKATPAPEAGPTNQGAANGQGQETLLKAEQPTDARTVNAAPVAEAQSDDPLLSKLAAGYGYQGGIDTMPDGLGKTARKLHKAIIQGDEKSVQEILHPDNKQSRKAFEKLFDGRVKLPSTVKGTQEVVKDFIGKVSAAVSSSNNPAATEKPSGAPVAAEDAARPITVKESPANKARRTDAGYTQVLRVNAQRLTNAYNAGNPTIPAMDNPSKISALAKNTDNFKKPVDGYPLVTFQNGAVGYEDGRHRVAAAIQRGGTVEVAMRKDEVDAALKAGADWIEGRKPSDTTKPGGFTEKVRKAAGKVDAAPAQPILTSPTKADIDAQQARAEQAAKAKAAQDKADAARAAKERERKDVAAASVAAADTFELGQDAMANLTGQQDVFGAMEQAAPQMTAEEAAAYLKDFVYNLDQLDGMTRKAQVLLNSPMGKSGRDTLLMEAFGISREKAHDINNRLDSRQPKKLRNIDMQEAFDVFPGLRKIVDDAIQNGQPKAKTEPSSQFTDLEKELQAQSHATELDGDIGIVAGGGVVRYVSLEDAAAAAKKAIESGVRPVAFQILDATGIRIGDVDRVLGQLDKKILDAGRAQVAASATTKMAKYDNEAKLYGYTVDASGAIFKGEKKLSPVVKEAKGRLRVESPDGKLLFSGAQTGEAFGEFLKSFWNAEKASAKAERQKAADDLKAALGDLGDIFSKNTRMNITAEQEQKLLPVLSRVMDAAFRLGYLKFKDAAKFALDKISDALGADVADQITLDHMQGAYIAMAGKYQGQGADTKKAVVNIEDRAEIENHTAQAADTKEEADVPSPNTSVERNSRQPATEPAVGDVVQNGRRPDSAGDNQVPGQPSGGNGGRQPNGAGVSADGPVVDGIGGDLSVHSGDAKRDAAVIATGAEFSERGSGIGNDGVSAEPVATGKVAAVAQSSSEKNRLALKQKQADSIGLKYADLDNIKATLPMLLDGQQEDVFKAETRFQKPDGYGMLFTNGTGTGKTFTGLGIIKRMARQGKTNILVVVPDEKIGDDWIGSAKLLGLNVSKLADTKDSGKGIALTTYANLGSNDALATRAWDLVVADEAHNLMKSSDGTVTTYLQNLRAITMHPDGAFQRYAMLNREKIDRSKALSEEITGLERMIAADSTTDQQRAAWDAKSEALQKELGALRGDLDKALNATRADVKANQGAKRTRLAALSATPFAYEFTIDWANGYLFDYNDGQEKDGSSGTGGRPYNSGSNRERFFMQHFGYSMRYNKLTKPDPTKVDTGLMQRSFNTMLKKAGSLSGRMLDVKADYDRRFVLVDSAIGNQIDEALNWISDQAGESVPGFSTLREVIGKKFDYLSRRYLLEAIKAKEAVPIVRKHMEMGRKVVVFHDYKKGGGFNPFNVSMGDAAGLDSATEDTKALAAAIDSFKQKFAALVNTPFQSLLSPIEVFSNEFPGVLLINGDEKKPDLLARYKAFQDDATGPQVALVQSAKNAGWSGHDTTGKHQRVLINLGQPTAPTLAIQQEGRIYRTGQVSNAIMRYMNTGTNWEKWAFATTIAGRASAAENLGMGELSRALKDSFIGAFEESDAYPPGHEGEGTGGKERDAAQNNQLTAWDRAKSLYWATQKKNSRTKAQEGVDYFATPEPVGMKMAEWLGSRGGERTLEPSAGHGAIASWLPETTKRTVIEPSNTLRSRLALVMNPSDDRILDVKFEALDVVNKFDGIAMNPPFGVGGKTAIEHLAKAATHLSDGGRIVALIPTGPAADKRFDQWMNGEQEHKVKPLGSVVVDGKETFIYKGDTIELQSGWAPPGVVIGWRQGVPLVKATAPEFRNAAATTVGSSAIKSVKPTGPRTERYRAAKDMYTVGEVLLPSVTFERAGTAVSTRIVVLEKQSKAENAPNQKGTIDLSGLSDINDLFDRMENLTMPDRKMTEAQKAEVEAEQKQAEASAVKTERNEAAKKQSAAVGDKVTLAGKEYDVVVYTTNAGKDIRGAWVKTKELATRFNDRTFQKKPLGWFVREKDFHRTDANQKPSVSRAKEQPLTPASTIRAAITSAYGNLLDKLEAKGLVTIAQTEREAIEAAAQARADKTGGDVEQIKRSMLASVQMQRVWHGSPHRFDKFSTEFMGKGEGEQAFGWGLYFASKMEIAESYRKELSGVMDRNNPDDVAAEEAVMPEFLALQDRYAIADEKGNEAEKAEIISYIEKIVDDLREQTLKRRPGQLYEVEIPKDSDMLLWDKPLSEQPASVRKILSKEWGSNQTGESFYKEKALSFGKGGYWKDAGYKPASEYLSSLGVKGIKYPARTRSGEVDGSYNYVIFDGADTQIVDVKYSANGNIEGFFDRQTGKSFLVADNLTAASAPGTLMHEVGIHMAADGKLEPLFKRAGSLLKTGTQNEFIQRVKARMARAGETSDEEAAAYIVTEYENDRAKAPITIGKWLADLTAAVRAWLFSKGIILKAEQLTVADIAAVARANARSMARGGSNGGPGGGQSFQRGTNSTMTENKASNVRSLLDIDGWEDMPEFQDDEESTVLFNGGSSGYIPVVKDMSNSASALWPGLFSSADVEKAHGPGMGSDITAFRIQNEKMANDFDDFDQDEVMDGLKKLLPKRVERQTSDDEDLMDVVWRAVVDDRFEKVQDEFSELFGLDLGEAGWEAQSLRGRLATALGLDAIAMRDEHGTSWYISPGVKSIPLPVQEDAGGQAFSRTEQQSDQDIRFSRAADMAGNAIDKAKQTADKAMGKDFPRAASMPDLNDDQRSLLGKVGASQSPASDAIKAATDRAGLKIRQGMVDRFAALKELDEKALGQNFIADSITNSAWVLAKMSSAGSGALNAMMKSGRIEMDANQKVIGLKGAPNGGLTASLQKLGGPAEVERFFAWMAANRAEKLMGEGRENLFTPAEIAAGKTLNTGTTEGGKVRPALYSQVHAEFQQYRDDVLAIAEQTGIINSENRAMWRDEFYVPFYRVMEDDADRGRSGGNGLSRQEAYKKLKGGKQNLNDLMENTLMNFHHLLSASLKNQAAAQAIKNAETVGIARKVPEARRDTKTSTFVLEKGKKVFYEVEDPLVFESITTLADPGLNNTAVRVMGAFKRVFTNMTTSTPQSIIANTFRDLLQASATSPTSKNIAKTLKEGIQSYRDEKTRAEMLASGGAFSFGHIYGMGADEVKASLQKTVAGAGLIFSPSMIPSILRKGWDAWGNVTDLAENASRAATYAQNVEQMGKLRAAFEARDVMDFSQHGAWPAVRLLVRIVPFLNARLQGLDKLYRSGLKPSILTAMGKGTDTDKQAAARFAMVTGALTLATMALYLVNADDDEYKKLEEWQKDTYWFIRIGENAFFLPKPFEVGAIATIAERTLQQAMDDKATGKLFGERMWGMLMQTFAFNPTPQMFQPLIDVYSNKDAFTGRDIESAGMERMSAGLRSRDTTTAPATALSAVSRVFGDESAIAVSPVQADHLIKGYLGGVGAAAAGWINTMYRAATGQSSPDKAWSEYQPIRRFYRDLDVPVANTRYTTLFYDGLKEANRVYADVMELQKLGRTEDAQALTTEKRSVLQMRIALNAQQRRMTEINNRMKEVRRSDKDGEWKRRELDLLNTQKAMITERMGKRIEDARAGA